MSRNRHRARKHHVFFPPVVKIQQNQIYLKDVIWNQQTTRQTVAHAQTIINVDLHLVMWVTVVSNQNEFRLNTIISYVVWLRIPLQSYHDRRLKLHKNEISASWLRNENSEFCDFLLHFRVLTASICSLILCSIVQNYSCGTIGYDLDSPFAWFVFSHKFLCAFWLIGKPYFVCSSLSTLLKKFTGYAQPTAGTSCMMIYSHAN